MRPARLTLVAGTLALPAAAPAATVTVTLPRPAVAEYKKPYVAGWIEPVGGTGTARSLFVWYDVRKAGGEPGTKWLADLRSWWRRAGRTQRLPADGVSGATRGPGSYAVPLPADLAPGGYVLSVEAARENGGRELVSVPVTVPAPGTVAAGRAAGHAELAVVVVGR